MAIKFGNIENAKKFHEAFEEMRNYVLKMEAKKIREEVDGAAKTNKEKSDEICSNDKVTLSNTVLAEKLSNLTVGSS